MSWGLRYMITELEKEIRKLQHEKAQLLEWKRIALNILTDDQLDFKPAVGKTLRQRLRETE